MAAEGSCNMMVFSVNIVGNRTANGHIFGSRRYWKEESPWNREIQYLIQRHPRLTAKDAGFRIEMQQFIHV